MLYYFVAFLLVGGSLAFSACLLWLPIWLLGFLGGNRRSYRYKKSIEDQVVDAQWRYDRLWRRRP